MSLQFPLKLDGDIYLAGESGHSGPVNIINEVDLRYGSEFTDSSGNSVTINGYDSSRKNEGKGLRITNLCAIRHGIIIKKCPGCGAELGFDKYGPSYRTTNERRDQSDCEECRGKY